MYIKNIYTLILLFVFLGTQFSNAQSILFQQEMEPDGNMIAASSTNSRDVHLADDFILTSDSQITSITLEGAQVLQNLSSILQSVDVFIIEAEELTTAPANENSVYQSIENMDGIELIDNGFAQTFIINLENVNLEANKKYWIIFSAHIDTPYPSQMTDWHNYPGQNTEGTSLARKYTNGAWSTEPVGMTFQIEGTTSLGTTEVFNSGKLILASTVVSDVLEVRIENFQSLSVYDMSGKLVLKSHDAVSNVSFLMRGNYVVIAKSKDGTAYNVKFIKK